ncbi:GAF domain-containing protein [Lyngbya sp. PCC 8106]|uniref:GAF domain-containing protein n=1 Tax=Lyngbya sp. (strain PCC 8106) TaxID=313612 RepID=UPI0000EAC265|nr:GAF domain-containing protein [Lyngbya sp. PCC 8106]EAW34860.1 methyl-accepting chemotaxis protein [Lyngbya sp. PCC 8106]
MNKNKAFQSKTRKKIHHPIHRLISKLRGTSQKQKIQKLKLSYHHILTKTSTRQQKSSNIEEELKYTEKILRDQSEQEQLTIAITNRIRQSLDLQERLNTTVIEVREFLKCDRVIIYQFNQNFGGTVIAESVGETEIPMLNLVIDNHSFQELYIQLYQQREIQAISDLYTAELDPDYIDLMAKFKIRANLAIPIVNNNQLWGLLVAQNCNDSREWKSLEISFLKQLTTQVAIAIQQSELYQQAQQEIARRTQIETKLQQKIEREKLLAAIAQRIRQSLDLDQTLNTTVREVRQLLQVDRTVIFRFQADWSGVVSVESVVIPELSILNTNIYDPCFSQTYIEQYKQGRIRAIEDISKARLSQCYVDLLTQFQVRANLVVPILQGQHLWGLLIAHQCTQPRQWQTHETELLEQLATQVGIAIAQSQLYEQTRRQAQREQALNQVIQAIRTSLDLQTIFSTAAEEVCKLLQAERTVIARYLSEEKLWRHVADYHQSPDLFSVLGLEITDENNKITARLKHLEVFQIEEKNNCIDEFKHYYAGISPGSLLIIPLHLNSIVWGSLGLVRNNSHGDWKTWEIELASAVADQLAIAIQQSELYQQLEQLAILDGLTQIANRRYFDQYLDQEWKRAQREQHSLSLLLLDVDHFKLYNDTYGHQAGDECLQRVAKAIQETLKRSSDLVARYGGEEFVILLPNTKAEGAIQITQDIHDSIQQLAIEHSSSSVSQFVTVSIGISTIIPQPLSRFEVLVSRADKALYKAKQQRNTYCLYC